MKHLGLFEGIGGFSLAARWAGWETVAWCEISPFCQRILKYHFPEAEGYSDIKTTDFKKYAGTIDVLTGGFPCQGFSLAGKRLGTEDDRYLWPEMLRVIDETKPRIIIGENVTGILSMEDKSGVLKDVFAKVENRQITRFLEVDHYEAIYTRQAKMLVGSICESLEARGYEIQPLAIPAASVQAPHIRERVWFIAYRQGSGQLRAEQLEDNTKNCGKRRGSDINQVCKVPPQNEDGNVAHASGKFMEGGAVGSESTKRSQPANEQFARRDLFLGQDWQNFPAQSPVRGGDDGVPDKLDGLTVSKWCIESIKAYGNAVVPQVVYEIFKAINACGGKNVL